jgi:2-polyprenyl-6-methoxyphenol hydroxylase-like FAD-dependent oxidoreductase
MTARKSYDALVVGARCAGAATAMLLARWGLRVLLIDRGDYGTDTISTHALMRGGILQLHRWGLLPRIAEAATPPVRETIFHYGDEAVEIPIAPSHGVTALYAPRRPVLDSALVDAASEAGVEVCFRHVLVGMRRDADGRVRGATIRDALGELGEIATSLVIGADGLSSAVARLVDAPVIRQGSGASAVIYGHWSGLAARGYHWYFRPGASAGVIPTNHGQHCVFAAMPAAQFRAGMRGEAGYRRVLAEAAPEVAEALASAQAEEPLQSFAGRASFLRQAWGPGWALVGDAGYFKDPLTAHGMTDAFRDAELLARAAGDGSEHAFAAYAATRDALSIPLIKATDAIASFEWDLETVRHHHHALNHAMKREVDYLAALEPPPAGRPTRAVVTSYGMQPEEVVQ